jgi:hypothetical protein
MAATTRHNPLLMAIQEGQCPRRSVVRLSTVVGCTAMTSSALSPLERAAIED